jgi:hypothetical protein
VNVDAAQVYLPADRAIPLGLIVNELVTNSLKHAWASRMAQPAVGCQVKLVCDGSPHATSGRREGIRRIDNSAPNLTDLPAS